MLEFILIVIIAIGSVGAIAEGATPHKTPMHIPPASYQQCFKAVVKVVSSEDAPAYVNACDDGATSDDILACKGKRQCILDAIDYQ